MEVKEELLSPCGLYCGVCAVYIAHRDNNLKFKKILAKGLYGPLITKVEDVQCEGCLSPWIVSKTCQMCVIRPCVQRKGFWAATSAQIFHVKRSKECHILFQKKSYYGRFLCGRNWAQRSGLKRKKRDIIVQIVEINYSVVQSDATNARLKLM